MRKLWGASNVRVYGGGSAEEEFLSDLEKLIGDYNRLVASPSSRRAPGGGSTSTSWQLTPTPILTVADLAALPRDRIIVMPSGAPPVLAEPIYWWNTRQADRVRESIATYDPAAGPRPPPRPRRTAQDGPWTTTGLNDTSRETSLAGAGRWSSRPCAACSSSTSPSIARKALDRPRPAGCSTANRSSGSRSRPPSEQLADLADPPGLYYLTLAEWVQEWLFPVYRRSVRGHERVWCPQWWRHAEAVARLEVAVAGMGAPAPRPRHRPVGVVSRPRRPPHDGPARRRRAVQRLRRPALRASPRASCPTTRRPRACSNPRTSPTHHRRERRHAGGGTQPPGERVSTRSAAADDPASCAPSAAMARRPPRCLVLGAAR